MKLGGSSSKKLQGGKAALFAAALTAVGMMAPDAAQAGLFSKKPTAGEQNTQQIATIPTCTKSLGSISVMEPEGVLNWWTGQQLPEPSKLIKVYVRQSKCFTLVDRGQGLDAAMKERALAESGNLQAKSNIGKSQIKAADYVLVPDLISQNDNASGGAVAGLLGGLLGGTAGAVVGGLNFKKKTADVTLTLTNVRTTEQQALTEGHANKTNIGWGAGAGFLGGALGGAGVGGYANTELGQVIASAYLQAYHDMVSQLGGLPADASAAAPQATN